MADKLVALLGPGDGPRLFIGRMPTVVARIVGLKDGEVLIIHDQGTIVVQNGGEYDLPESQFVQFKHDGKSKSLICTLLAKAHAIPSP